MHQQTLGPDIPQGKSDTRTSIPEDPSHDAPIEITRDEMRKIQRAASKKRRKKKQRKDAAEARKAKWVARYLG